MTWDLRFQQEYLRRLKGQLRDSQLDVGSFSIQQINEDIERLIAEYLDLMKDEKTRPHLRLASAVLASYQSLCPHVVNHEGAINLAESAFVSVGSTMLTLYTKVLLLFSRDPFHAIPHAGKKRLDEQYGHAWDYRMEESTTSISMIVTKCFYHDFFTAVQIPDLTRVFCRWDSNWIDPIDPDKHGIFFERPTTLGYGGEECQFRFTRVEKG